MCSSDLDWYALEPSAQFNRFGPYVEVKGDTSQSPEQYARDRKSVV